MPLVTCNEKQETVVLRASFRCRNCGHLVHSGHAGERSHPRSCPVCKEGLVFGASREDIKAKRPDIFPEPAAKPGESPRWHKVTVAPGVELHHYSHHENWEVLADATPERLVELGLTAAEVERHTPGKAPSPTRTGQHFERTAEELPGSTDAVAGG
jgi:hypothetical protein